MSSDDNKVGYKKPPKSSQFKPGQSGNPTGKRSGVRHIATELQEILSEQITFAENGNLRTMSKQRALATSLITAAISGDLRATAIVMSHISREFVQPASDEDIDHFEAVRNHRKTNKRRG